MRQWTHALSAVLVVVALSAGAATLNGQQNAGTNTNGPNPRPFSAGAPELPPQGADGG
jgi:hypothetical protein